MSVGTPEDEGGHLEDLVAGTGRADRGFRFEVANEVEVLDPEIGIFMVIVPL